jgi:hypothetical protein
MMFLDKDRMMDNVQKHNICTRYFYLAVIKKGSGRGQKFILKAAAAAVNKSTIIT